MKKRNFTVSEIVIVIVVLGILITVGIPIYNNTIENARAKACELNLKTILGAVEAQTLEHNAFPASLSKIDDKNFEKAWAKVLKEEGAFKVKLTYFLVDLDESGLAYAQAAVNEPWVHRFITDPKVLTCPSAHGGNSYGINSTLTGKTYEQYKAEPDGLVVVGDCSNNQFSNISQLQTRHKEYGVVGSTDYAVSVTKSHKKHKVHAPGSNPNN